MSGTALTFSIRVGLAYGGGLAVLAFFATGAGHGTYIPVAVSSAPAGFFGVSAGLLGAPALWGMVGALVQRPAGRRVALLILPVHYASAIWLVHSEPFGDWSVLPSVMRLMPEIIVAWLGVYVAGQIWVWSSITPGVATKARKHENS